MTRSPVALLATTAATLLLAPAAVAATTERVSLDSAGGQANSPSGESALNADARFVAFTSTATNLVPGDTNLHPDVFGRGRVEGGEGGGEGGGGGAAGEHPQPHGQAAVHAGGPLGRLAAVGAEPGPSDTNANSDVFVRDRQTGGEGGVHGRGRRAPAEFGQRGAAVHGGGR